MDRAHLLSYLLITALATGTAGATGGGSPDDPALKVTLSEARVGSAFLLEVETLMGFEFEGEVLWTVNGVLVDSVPTETELGSHLDVMPLELAEATVACARLRGRLSLGGDFGRDADEEDCVLWLPSDARPSSPVLAVPKSRRQPAIGPTNLALGRR